jgi:hypothetical protein
MSVRGVGRGGKSGRAQGAAGPAKAGAAFGGKVDKTVGLVGPSGAAGSSNVMQTVASDPVTAKALELVRQLRTGELKSREEATKKLVTDILREKMKMSSKKMTERVVDELKADPSLNQTLERLWNRADEQE